MKTLNVVSALRAKLEVLNRRREEETLSYMRDLSQLDLDEQTHKVLERLVNKRTSDDVGLMVIRWPPLIEDIWQEGPPYKTWDPEHYHGILIEGIRVRFLGKNPEMIDEISYGEFIRRIPYITPFMRRLTEEEVIIPMFSLRVQYKPCWIAYQLVREDEHGIKFRLQGEDDLYGEDYYSAGVTFSNGDRYKENFPARYGEKSLYSLGYRGVDLEYMGVMTSGFGVKANVQRGDQKLISALNGVLTMIEAYKGEVGTFIGQPQMTDLLDHFKSVLDAGR